MDQVRIGAFMKALRKERNLTQEQLAEQLNVSDRTVSRWETGRNMPDISLLAEIAALYDVSIPELIDGERKSEQMKEETKEVASKMADYAGTEKAIIIKNIRNQSLLGVCAFLILLILEIAVPEGYSRITDLAHVYCETLIAVSVIMIFLISTGLLYKIQKKQNESGIPKLLWLIIAVGASIVFVIAIHALQAFIQ